MDDEIFDFLGFDFNKIWNDTLNKGISERDILLFELDDAMKNPMNKSDIVNLQFLVYNRLDKVIKLNDNILFRSHIVASLLVDRSDLAFSSLHLVLDAYPGDRELRGLVHFNNKSFSLSADDLNKSTIPRLPYKTLIAKVLSNYHVGSGSLDSFKSDLSPIVERSLWANRLLSIFSFNDCLYADAYSFFESAKKIAHKEDDYIASLQSSIRINEKNIFVQKGNFYRNTDSSLSPDVLEKRLVEDKIVVPTIKIPKLYTGAKYLLVN